MIGLEDEGPRPPHGEGFTDHVSYAFADAERELYGLARIGVARPEGRASALAVLFAGDEVATGTVEGDVEVGDPGWDDLRVAGVRARTAEPLVAWRTELDGADAGFELDFAAVSDPLELGPDTPAAQTGGTEGYEHVCRVEGEVRIGGDAHRIDCLGQRSHGWGPSPWNRIELARTVSAWLDGPRAVTLSAVRPAASPGHGEEAATAFLVEPGPERAAASQIAEARLSTTYDAAGRQRRAGLELWMSAEDDLPRRAVGEVVCGTSLELGRLRLDCAFLRWWMDGRTRCGRYDILRRA